MNQTNIKVDPDNKKMKLDRFMVKKIILGIIRGDHFLYISFKFDYKVSSRLLQCFSLCFPIPLPWSFLPIIQSPLNDLGLPLVGHPSLYLSAYPIGHPLQVPLCLGTANVALFRGLLHINVARKLTTQLKCGGRSQIFQDFSLYFVFVMLIHASRTSKNVPLDGQPPIRTSASLIQGDICHRPTLPCHYDQN